MQTIDVFARLTAESPLADLCAVAASASASAAAYDLSRLSPAELLTGDWRAALSGWLGAYRHDEATLGGLSEEARVAVLGAAEGAYEAAVRLAWANQ